MTAQMPDELLNLHPSLDLGGLQLYRICRGDITTNHGWGDDYPFERQPSPIRPGFTCSALWRGHVATFRIDAEARVTLLRYEYPSWQDLPEGARTEDVGEELTGEFWLVLKERFSGPRVYVPVQDGRIVLDPSRWVREPEAGPSLLNAFDDV